VKCAHYVQCYSELSLGLRPKSVEGVIDYCVDRPVLMGQVRSEILQLGNLLKQLAPKRSLEIGTNYGGTLFLLCTVSAPKAKIISLDLPFGPFGGGYPSRKIPIFRRFPDPGKSCTSSGPTRIVRKPRIACAGSSGMSNWIWSLLMGIIHTRACHAISRCMRRWYAAAEWWPSTT
jgi:hypothetical protein